MAKKDPVCIFCMLPPMLPMSVCSEHLKQAKEMIDFRKQVLADLRKELKECKKEHERNLLEGNTKASFYWAGRKEQTEWLAKKWGMKL